MTIINYPNSVAEIFIRHSNYSKHTYHWSNKILSSAYAIIFKFEGESAKSNSN